MVINLGDTLMKKNVIDEFINKQCKPLVLVGLNDNGSFGKKKNSYYDVHSQYNYYVDIDDMTVLKQKCIRLLNHIQKYETIMDELVNDNAKFIRTIGPIFKNVCNAKRTIRQNAKWNKDYERMGYKFMTRENIYKAVVRLLNNNL